MSRSCPWSKKAACYCSLIRESKTAAAPKGERDAAYADLPLNHSCLRGPTSFMIICRRLFDLTPSASLCEGTPKPRSTIIWREGPALYSTVCDATASIGETPWKCTIASISGMAWKWRGNAPSKGGSWICRGFSKEIVEMPWKIGAQARAGHTHGVESARRGNAVEIRGAKWKCRGNS